MQKVVVIFSVFISNYLISQDSLSILFIGNSYTYVNDLPGTLNSLTLSLGDEITFDSQAIGGATFQTQVNTSSTYSKIHSKAWDFVVLQGQSQEPSFPYDQVNTETIPYAIQLADSVYANKFCSQVMMYMTWGRQSGDPQWDSISTFNGMNDRLRSAYLRIMDSVQGSMSPVGSAWRYVRDNYPSINLYSSDGSHPSPEGTYLAACTFYASLFRKSPVGASFISTIGQSNATILQNAAALTVLDSLDFWNLHPVTDLIIANFSIIQTNEAVQFTNSTLKAIDYVWDFGDGSAFSTDESPLHIYESNGLYTVTLIAVNPCDADTFNLVVEINNLASDASIEETKDVEYTFINNEEGSFQMIFENENEREFQLYDLKGQLILKELFNSNDFQFDFSRFKPGLYMIKIISNNQSSLKRVYIN